MERARDADPRAQCRTGTGGRTHVVDGLVRDRGVSVEDALLAASWLRGLPWKLLEQLFGELGRIPKISVVNIDVLRDNRFDPSDEEGPLRRAFSFALPQPANHLAEQRALRIEGEEYGEVPPDVMLPEIEKYPRYDIVATKQRIGAGAVSGGRKRPLRSVVIF